MGWFDEQIRQRKRYDEEMFRGAFEEIAGAVMGKRLSQAYEADRQAVSDALGDLLRCLHVKETAIPEGMKSMDEILEYLLRPAGIMRRPVKLGQDWYRTASGPMLGTWKADGRVVALIPGSYAGYTFRNPDTGKKERVGRSNVQSFDAEAIAFYRPFPQGALGTADLLKYMAQSVPKSEYVLLGLLMLVITLIGMITPALNSWLFTYVTPSRSITALSAAGVFLVSAVLSRNLFDRARSIMLSRIRARMSDNAEAAAMMRVLTLPTGFFRQYQPGELAARVGYVRTLCETIADAVLTTGFAGLLSLLYITQFVTYAPSLAGPAVLIILATLAVSIASSAADVRCTREALEAASKENGFSYEALTGIQKIRLAGAEKRVFGRWGSLYAKKTEKLYNPPFLVKCSGAITAGISLFGTVILYAIAIKSGVSQENYYAFQTAYAEVTAAFASVSGLAASFAQIKAILYLVEPILKTLPEVSEDKQVVTRLSGGIELTNVTFRYAPSMPPVLDNLSLKIRPGQYVAVCGTTGCGKSTLMRVMLGFEKPQKGAVYYDGRDLARMDLKSLRSRIGTVMQDSGLFAGDIYSNISILAPGLSIEGAWEAAEMAGIKEDIERMPMGMFTMISEGQGGISGGQKQRLMIARAVAAKPRILMFDEATSALDNITQKKVSDALAGLKCTRIVIAHRLSTIRDCDRIIVLDQGRIAEDGTYEDLIAKGGLFADLVARQRVDL